MTDTRQRCGDWHGVQAMKAYRRKDYDAYRRHARIAELLWKEPVQ
jgi:hypothetical protein